MPKNFLKGFFTVAAILFLAGCGVQARSYIQVKDRLDQEAKGNAGYLMGSPAKAEPQAEHRKTRRVYVLEFSKENEIPDEDNRAPKISTPSSIDTTPPPSPARPERQRIVLPNFGDEQTPPSQASAPVGPTTATEYTVEKDDTMQKISKKFYGSYSKWTKIYEANKDRIPDPNRIKPGITITIPSLQ